MRVLSGFIAAIVASLIGFVVMIGTGVVWIISLLLSIVMVACFATSLFMFAGCFFFAGPTKYLTAFGFLGYSAAAFVSITVLHYGLDVVTEAMLPKAKPIKHLDVERIGGLKLARDAEFD